LSQERNKGVSGRQHGKYEEMEKVDGGDRREKLLEPKKNRQGSSRRGKGIGEAGEKGSV